MKRQYVIGIDYGSDSCRTIVSDVLTGNSIAEAECDYPRWKSGKCYFTCIYFVVHQ